MNPTLRKLTELPTVEKYVNATCLLQEPIDPIASHLIAYKTPENNYSVVEFFYEDSGVFNRYIQHTGPRPYGIVELGFYELVNSTESSDGSHYLAVFDCVVYEILCISFQYKLVSADSELNAISKYLSA